MNGECHWMVNGEALTNAQTVHFRFSIHNDDVCVCVWHMRERAPKFYSQLNSSVKRDSLCGVQFLSEYCYYLVKLVCFHICFTLRLSSAQNAKECRIKCLERIRDFLSNCWKWKRQKKREEETIRIHRWRQRHAYNAQQKNRFKLLFERIYNI